MGDILFPKDIIKETGLHKDIVYDMLKHPTCPCLKFGTKYMTTRGPFYKWMGERHEVERSRKR